MATPEVASPALMMALALERAVANLGLTMALERVAAKDRNLAAEVVLMMELDTKDLMMVPIPEKVAAKAPVSQVLTTDTLEEEEMVEILAIMTTMVATEEEMVTMT